MNNFKVIFLFVVMVMAFALAGCQAGEAAATRDWELYENHALGYSVKYPKDCTFGPMPSGCKGYPPEERPPECLCFLNATNPNEVFLQMFVKNEVGELNLASFSVVQFDPNAHSPADGTDVAAYVEENFPELPGEVPAESNAEIGGVAAARVYNPGSPQALSYEQIYFIRDGKLFVIMLGDGDREEIREFYETLLGTLGF